MKLFCRIISIGSEYKDTDTNSEPNQPVWLLEGLDSTDFVNILENMSQKEYLRFIHDLAVYIKQNFLYCTDNNNSHSKYINPFLKYVPLKFIHEENKIIGISTEGVNAESMLGREIFKWGKFIDGMLSGKMPEPEIIKNACEHPQFAFFLQNNEPSRSIEL